jgi:hypothetical protein
MRSAALLALLAALLVPAAALAQATPTPTPSATVSASPTATPSPTPTPTATPAPRTKAVQKVYDDYASDGTISVCKYSVKTLKRTLRTITPQFDTNFPDFRAAVKAGIKRHQRGNCKPAAATATPAPTATAAPTAAAPTPVPTAVPTAAPTSSPLQSGRLPSGTLHPVGPPKTPKQAKTPGTLTPSGTPAPTTITPTPAPTEFGPPRLVVQRASGHRDLTVPGALLGLALLMAVLLGFSALAAARSPRLAGVHHAWREAAYRTRGTWRDFSEWLRLGR